MDRLVRIVPLAVAAVVGVAVGAIAFRPSSATMTMTPAITAVPGSPAPSRLTENRPVADGTYDAQPIPVADVLNQLEADTELDAEGRAAVIRLLNLAPPGELYVRMAFQGDQFALSYGRAPDGLRQEAPWRLFVLDPTTIAVHRRTGTTGIQAYAIERDGESFKMRALSPAPDAVESFVRSVLFETPTFSPST